MDTLVEYPYAQGGHFAMAKKDKEMLSLQKLAGIPPVLPVISDHPLEKETAGQDKFDLCYRLGPIFDIIRHKNTAMPTTIAIYGDWGVGKTSAMKWLEALIKEWNEQPDGPDKTTVHPVWFYPWKYHDKEDVWRGLIAEVILTSISVKGADLPRVEKAAKQFGLFLGRSFLHVLGAVNEKAGSAVQKTIEEFNRVNHPEKAYLNEFESSLKEWTDETLSDNDRMVIFIDDLDRCMPEIALQVLEALKLYLNLKKLIFVVGVDRDVIEQLVKKHYIELGLDDSKSGNYLAKMFQTEVTVGPSERQVTDYLDEQLEKIEYFSKKYLTADEKSLFKGLIEKFADRNPREVKRLINSAVMAGAGVEMLKTAGVQKLSLSFKQGLQVFFIRKIVENPKTYNMPRLVGSIVGNKFFETWSKIVCENGLSLPLNIQLSEEYIQKLQQTKEGMLIGGPDGSITQILTVGKKQKLPENPPGVPGPYLKLIQDFRFRSLLHLLRDENLGRLMQIEFSSEIAEITQKVETLSAEKSDEEKIREAIAQQLNKKPDELHTEDFKSIKILNLNFSGINDIYILNGLTNLTDLMLEFNHINNINPLKDLINLTELNLHANQISDISPLKGLTNLTELYLSGNNISDINPLNGLTNLTELVLHENQISDISPLKGLTNLTELYLSRNQISDISPLKGLMNLTRLDLWGNPITDITDLKNLNKLKYLNILGCHKITDEQTVKLMMALPNLKINR
jgi:Leucine-rich repeat (LRR) protein